MVNAYRQLPTKSSQRESMVIDGKSLSATRVAEFVKEDKQSVVLSPTSVAQMRRSHNLLLRRIKKQAIYGVNTGFGPMVTHIMGQDRVTDLQYNLLRGHAVGMGEPIRNDYVLAAMLVRLNTLAKGFSGTTPELAQTLASCINARITPIVPRHGAVGASGDLVQLAHVALMLIGEGEVVYAGERMSASTALRSAGIEKHTLLPKEGLSLINGTSMMSGIGCILAEESSRLLSIAVRTGALAFELVRGITDVLDPRLHAVRPHEGQKKVSQVLRRLVRGSKLTLSREKLIRNVHVKHDSYVTDTLLQEVYSLRCIPQILGPVADTLLRTRQTLNVEINSSTDNPIIDIKRELFLHGGNFHGDYIASELDHLKIALIKMTMLSERRINFFVNNSVNKKFSPFLNLVTPGLTMGLQGLQFVATSTAAHSQSLGYPHSLHSIPTNADNQDVVSMGTDAALIASKAMDNARIVLAIELVALSQAAAYLKSENKLSPAGRRLIYNVRKYVPVIKQDRTLSNELNKLCAVLAYDDTFDIDW